MSRTSTRSIEWHKECYKNILISINNDFEKIKQDLHFYIKWMATAKFLELQIETAKKQNKTSFDADIFLKNNKDNFIEKEMKEQAKLVLKQLAEEFEI